MRYILSAVQQQVERKSMAFLSLAFEWDREKKHHDILFYLLFTSIIYELFKLVITLEYSEIPYSSNEKRP